MWLKMSHGEVNPQSAITPVTVSGSSVPHAISTAVAPIEMPSSTICTSPPARSVRYRAQSRTSNRSRMPYVIYLPSLSPCAR